MNSKSHQVLKVFHIVMINVIAVDSIRTLPFAAKFGYSLVFYYLLIGLLFFVPSGLISAELGTGWPQTGGIYVWVKEAFGPYLGGMVIWIYWVFNLFWFPTLLSLIAATSTYFFNPEFAQNKLYMLSMTLIFYWVLTLCNCLGMRVSSFLSVVGAIVGTLIPMAFISILGFFWFVDRNPLEIDFTWSNFFPKKGEFTQLAYLSNVLFGLLGLEMVATHAKEMRNPKRDFPKAMGISMIIILISIICSALAIAIVVPNKEILLAVGTLQAFTKFFTVFDMPWMTYVIAFFIIIGGLGAISAWIIGPTKGLLIAAKDGLFPEFFSKAKKDHTPARILITQAIIVSVLSFFFIIMPTVNSSFWILSQITAQLALLTYMGLFAAGIRLHHTQLHVPRTFKIPFGKTGIWLFCGIGFITCLASFILGFIPPPGIDIGNIWTYEILLCVGMFGFTFLPLLIFHFFRKKKKAKA